MKLSDILPVFLAISSVTNNVDAQCSFMDAKRRLNSRGSRVSRNLQEEEEEDDEFESGFTYGRMVNTTVVASYKSPTVSDIIIAGNGYMNSSVRDTGFLFSRIRSGGNNLFIDRNGNITDTPTGSLVLDRATSSVLAGQAGYTYLGQLLSHDMNKDGNSVMGVHIDPELIMNKNTPHIDLDRWIGCCGPNKPYLRGPPPRCSVADVPDRGRRQALIIKQYVNLTINNIPNYL